MEIRTRQNLYRNYWLVAMGIVLLPEFIFFAIEGFDDTETVVSWIGYRTGTAFVYFTLISLVSAVLFLFTYLHYRSWDFERYLKVLALGSSAYALYTLVKPILTLY